MITTSLDKTIRIWDLQAGTLLKTLSQHTKGISSILLTPDEKTIIAGGHDKTIRLWDIETGVLQTTFTGHIAAPKELHFTQQNTVLVSSSGKDVKAWDLTNKQGKASFPSIQYKESIYTAISADGSKLLTTSYATEIWDLKTAAIIETRNPHASKHYGILASPTDDFFIQKTLTTKALYLEEISSNKTRKTLSGHTSHVEELAFSNDGTWLVSSDFSNNIKLWDLGSDKNHKSIKVQKSFIVGLAISPDNKILAYADLDKTIYLWDIANAKMIREIKGYRRARELQFSPDGKILISAGEKNYSNQTSIDGIISAWEVSTGKLIRSFVKHTKRVNKLLFFPDGKHFASASSDTSIIIWELATGKAVQTIQAHHSPVVSLSLSPDGKQMASGSIYGSLKLWK